MRYIGKVKNDKFYETIRNIWEECWVVRICRTCRDILPIVYPTFLQYVAYSNMQYLGLICPIVMIFARDSEGACESSANSINPFKSYARDKFWFHTYIHTYIHTYTQTHTHTYIRTYIHASIHTYIHTYIHIHTFFLNLLF